MKEFSVKIKAINPPIGGDYTFDPIEVYYFEVIAEDEEQAERSALANAEIVYGHYHSEFDEIEVEEIFVEEDDLLYFGEFSQLI